MRSRAPAGELLNLGQFGVNAVRAKVGGQALVLKAYGQAAGTRFALQQARMPATAFAQAQGCGQSGQSRADDDCFRG